MIVVDGSAIVDALTGGESADRLRELLQGEELHAPALIDYEVVSALRGLALAGHLSETRAEDALADYADLRIQLWSESDEFRRRAFQLRNNVTAYDAAYVVLAEALECPLATCDRRLARSGGHGVAIRACTA